MTNEKESPFRLHGILAQVLDGLWFLEVEKSLGFDRAYEIDEAVWIAYAKKEARRVRSYLGFDKPSVADLERTLALSLFHQSVAFTLKVSGPNDGEFVRVTLSVVECKTLDGMRRVGRPGEQIRKICHGIGLAFYQNLLDELVPGTRVRCLNCPGMGETTASRCRWEFDLPRNGLR
ncbi:MAG: hypothetical protein Kow0069_29990 [Promethearchaeota archaeon]